jgi:hypothetical protein
MSTAVTNQPKVAKPKATKATKTTKATETKTAKKALPKQKRVKKERTAPKRPRTAFIMYLSDHRENIIKSNPGIKFTDITKVGAEQWKQAKPAVKSKYEKAAEEDKARYAKEMETYVPDPNEKKKKRKQKDPNAPKKANTAYIFFVQSRVDAVKKAHPDYKMTEVMADLGQTWKALSEKEKKQFKDLAAKDAQRYEAEMAKYKAKA